MSKKVVDKKEKKSSKKMTLAIKIMKSKKSGYYTFENKMIPYEETKVFFTKKK
nr:DUF4295 family protein [Blattabacterium cuenoti]